MHKKRIFFIFGPFYRLAYRISTIYILEMAFASKNEFPKRDIKLAALFKALSHPGRIAILKVLAKKDSCICGELVADLPLAQSTVSQHLRVLKEADLIKGEVDGPRSCYCLNKKTVKQFSDQFNFLFSDLSVTDRTNKNTEC